MGLSVIIPTLNEEKYLPKLLKSIEKQEFEGKYEILVVDSMSNDATQDIARDYGAKVIETERLGAGWARNVGARYAKYKNLLFLDADIILPKNAFSSVVETLERKDVVALTAKYIYDNKKYFRTSILSCKFNKILLERLKFGVLPAFFLGIRKDIFFYAGGFPKKFSRDDLEFTLKLRKIRGKFIMLSDVTVIVSSRRFNSDGLIRSFIQYLTASAKLYRPIR